MTPFCIDKLILDMEVSFLEIKKDVIKFKFKFTNEFKKEINNLLADKYGEEVFDFIFNLYDYKKVFNKKEFLNWRDFIRDCNFIDEIKVRENIQKVYMNFLTKYKLYFMETLKLEHDCQDYVNLKIKQDKKGMVEKLMRL